MWKIAIVFLLVAVNFGYWYWTTTPFYSILEIKESVVHHDLKTFEQYVDVERVSSHMIDGFLTPQVRSRLSKGVLGELLGSSLISLVKPTLMDIIKNEVSHFVESNQLAANQAAGRVTRPRKRAENATAPAIGHVLKVTKTKDGKLEFEQVPAKSAQADALPANSIDSEDTADATQKRESADDTSSAGPFAIGALSMKNVTGKLGFGKHAFKKIAFIRAHKNDCSIGVTLFNKRYNTNMLLELRMEKQGEHWKLVEVSNFPSFVYLIIAYEQARKDKMG